ncbi:MAG: 16S rRNA (cytidine(1402)-2'-O)-methyltransferase [Clostridiales bacterium]|nr:16S rRNA (cytidine(1402)-2'-O)-methyltransferase [Clostridiales bacterium]
MSGILYLVGTPIGNLGDFSPRAVQTLEEVDFIAAEDTRVTLKLLNHFGIRKPMLSYFEHNRRERGEQIAARLLAGESCALVTDAGMPAVSDPGEDLVALCHERGIPVRAVPGPAAFVTALALSGLPVGRFTFEGFLSVNKRSRREHLASLAEEMRTMVFYEAPHKLPGTLRDLYQALGDRRIAIVREMTKVHEEVIRTTLEQAVLEFADGGLRGEIVLVIEGAEKPAQDTVTLDEAVETARGRMEGGQSASDAARQTARETGLKKGDIYKALLEAPEETDANR